jgi:integrase
MATVLASCRAFLDHLNPQIDAGKLSPGTRAYYDYQFRHLIDVAGKLELAAVRATHLLWAPHTNAFVRCFKTLVRHHKLPQLEDLPTPREGQRERTLDEIECEQFWKSCVGREREITQTIYRTGLRPQEARELTSGQIREERRVIELRKFKGQSTRADGLRRRGVPLPSAFREVLPFLSREKTKFGDRIFTNRRGRPWTCQALRLAVRQAAWRAGFDADGGEHITAYTFRHSFASNFIRGGGNPVELARIMGHAQLDTTDRYCHLSDSDLVAALDRAQGKQSVTQPGPAKLGSDIAVQIVQCGDCGILRTAGNGICPVCLSKNEVGRDGFNKAQ